MALLACIGCTFLFSSVACFIFSSLAFLLALEGLHPLKLDEVGFCVVATFKASGGLAVGLVPCFCFARWLAHSRAVRIVSAAGDLFAGLYWWPCKKFSCSSGQVWRCLINRLVLFRLPRCYCHGLVHALVYGSSCSRYIRWHEVLLPT